MNARKAKALRRLAHYKGERPPLKLKFMDRSVPTGELNKNGQPVCKMMPYPTEARYPKDHPRAYYQLLKKILPKGTPHACFV
jgi:hypothetical protein